MRLTLLSNMHFATADVVGLSPEGRGLMEAVVSIPNQYLAQIPPPSPEDMRALVELSPSGTVVSKKCAINLNLHT